MTSPGLPDVLLETNVHLAHRLKTVEYTLNSTFISSPGLCEYTRDRCQFLTIERRTCRNNAQQATQPATNIEAVGVVGVKSVS